MTVAIWYHPDPVYSIISAIGGPSLPGARPTLLSGHNPPPTRSRQAISTRGDAFNALPRIRVASKKRLLDTMRACDGLVERRGPNRSVTTGPIGQSNRAWNCRQKPADAAFPRFGSAGDQVQMP